MKIGNVDLKNDLLLAPMAGYTDVGFRKICKDFGCALTYTEMISAKALIFDSKKTQELLFTQPQETPKAVQLFGHEPEVFVQAIKSGLLDKFDIIDINMGCPAPKIVKNKEGSFLLTDIKLATKIAQECVKNTNKPVTVKMRLGFNNENVALDFAKSFEDVGVSAVAIHGRTRDQMYSGKANYEEIAKIKNALSIPVIANGDVEDRQSYNLIKSSTNADFVMIGRGAIGNPKIFADILHKPINKSKLDCILEHISILEQYYNEKFIVLNMRKHLACYLKGMGLSSAKKLELMQINDLTTLKEECKKIFSN